MLILLVSMVQRFRRSKITTLEQTPALDTTGPLGSWTLPWSGGHIKPYFMWSSIVIGHRWERGQPTVPLPNLSISITVFASSVGSTPSTTKAALLFMCIAILPSTEDSFRLVDPIIKEPANDDDYVALLTYPWPSLPTDSSNDKSSPNDIITFCFGYKVVPRVEDWMDVAWSAPGGVEGRTACEDWTFFLLRTERLTVSSSYSEFVPPPRSLSWMGGYLSKTL